MELVGEAFIQCLIAGFLLGGVYSLASLGLSLVFGVLRVLNIAHGSLLMLGAYITYFAFTLFGIDPFISLFISMPILFVAGAGIQKALLTPARKRARGISEAKFQLMTIIMFFGISLFIDNSALLVWSAVWRQVTTAYATSVLKVSGLVFSLTRLLTFIAAALITVVLYVFLMKTYIGRAIRATAENRDAAMLMGVNIERVSLITFGIGAATAGAAGSLLSGIYAFNATMGTDFILLCNAVVILGGLGSVVGSMYGGLIMGIAESVVAFFFTSNIRSVVAYLTLILMLIFKPSGLFGKEARRA